MTAVEMTAAVLAITQGAKRTIIGGIASTSADPTERMLLATLVARQLVKGINDALQATKRQRREDRNAENAATQAKKARSALTKPPKATQAQPKEARWPKQKRRSAAATGSRRRSTPAANTSSTEP